MLNKDQMNEMQEWAEGIKATNNFLQEKTNVEKYVSQAVELFHNSGQDDKDEIAVYARQELSK